jgi:hypothetical protein
MWFQGDGGLRRRSKRDELNGSLKATILMRGSEAKSEIRGSGALGVYIHFPHIFSSALLGSAHQFLCPPPILHKETEPSSTSPHAQHAISTALNHITIPDTDALDHGGGGAPPAALLVPLSSNTGAAVPMAAVGLVVDFRVGFARGGHDAARVEHHARDGLVVGVGVEDAASAEVPYLWWKRLVFEG